MYKRIVVGWDASEQARDALALARTLRASDGIVTAVSVHPRGSRGGLDEAGVPSEQAALRDERNETPEWLENRAVVGASAAHGLHGTTEEGADLVVVGASRRGESGEVSTGTVGERLLNGSPCPVAVAPAGYSDRRDESPRVVGVAYDGSPEADACLTHAEAFARGAGTAIQVITVVPPVEVWTGETSFAEFEGDEDFHEARRAEFERVAREAAGRLGADVRVETVIREGDPAAQIIEASRDGVDLMMMGSRNYGPIRRVMVGSTAIELLRLAPCPVIVLPRAGS